MPKEPCNRKCAYRKYWIKERPHVSPETKNWKITLNAMLVCITCVHFVTTDNYVYEE